VPCPVDFLHSNFTWAGSSPSTILGIKKLDTGLPDGEDGIPLHSLILTQYRSVTDRHTDRWMDEFALAYTALAQLDLRCTVKMNGLAPYIHVTLNGTSAIS